MRSAERRKLAAGRGVSRWRGRRLLVLGGASVLTALGLAVAIAATIPGGLPGSRPAQPAGAAQEAAEVAAALTFTPARNCRTCHAAIYEEWRSSWMAAAYANVLFQRDFARFRETSAEHGRTAASCLRCHAPAALLSQDAEARNALAQEGVTCEICHRVGQVNWQDDTAYLAMDPRPVIRGRQTIAHAPHPVQGEALLAGSDLCAGCHHDRSGDVYLERTYREWADGPYAAEGVECISCHMPSTPGPATAGGPGASHASHRFPGGHPGSPLLDGAAEVEIVAQGPGRLELAVVNARVGHNFPTGGAHDFRLDLVVEGVDAQGDPVWQASRTYAADRDAAVTRRSDRRAGAAGPRDTSLAPRERRVERFSWADGADGADGVDPARFEIRLVYHRYPDQRVDDAALAEVMQPSTIFRCAHQVGRGGAPDGLRPCAQE